MNCRKRWTVSGDGASLAFWDEGQGPAVILTNGYANTTLYWNPLRERLRENYRVIRWDYRGHGASGPARKLETMTIDGCVDDLRRVMDAAGVERAVLAGFSLGCQVVLEAWRHFPERIEAIIPVLGPCERPFDTLIHPQIGPRVFDLYRRLPAEVWGRGLKVGALGSWLDPVHRIGKLVGFIGRTVSMEEMEPFYTHLAQLDVPSWYVLGLSAQRHSARDLLPRIDVPTLVIAGGRDRFSPGEVSREVAEEIPKAELVWLENATHTGLFGERDEIGRAVEEFLKRRFEDNETGDEWLASAQ